MATTIINSISVKPFCTFSHYLLYSGRLRPLLEQLACQRPEPNRPLNVQPARLHDSFGRAAAFASHPRWRDQVTHAEAPARARDYAVPNVDFVRAISRTDVHACAPAPP